VFKTAAEMGPFRQGSRGPNVPNSHRQANRTYPLRPFVFCELCDRRMYGKVRGSSGYYVCQRDDRHHAERRDWYDTHPKSLWVREDDLLDLTHHFFADHVLGPRRQEVLRKPHQTIEPAPNPTAVRLQAEIADLATRRQNLLAQMEEHQPTGDDEIDRDLRARLRDRYAQVAREHKANSEQLTALTAHREEPDDDPTVLDQLPVITGNDVAAVPEALLRNLYDSFNLQLRYHAPDRTVTIRVTVREDRIRDIRSAINQVTSPPGRPADGRPFPSSWHPQRGPLNIGGTPDRPQAPAASVP
jgi:site-specific DNA recombinase